MIIEIVSTNYRAALLQAEIEDEIIYNSKIPKRANASVWYERLERISRNKGMTPRLRGLHGEVKRRYSKPLLEDQFHANEAYVVIELSGAELKQRKESLGLKWSRYKVFRFITFKH